MFKVSWTTLMKKNVISWISKRETFVIWKAKVPYKINAFIWSQVLQKQRLNTNNLFQIHRPHKVYQHTNVFCKQNDETHSQISIHMFCVNKMMRHSHIFLHLQLDMFPQKLKTQPTDHINIYKSIPNCDRFLNYFQIILTGLPTWLQLEPLHRNPRTDFLNTEWALKHQFWVWSF